MSDFDTMVNYEPVDPLVSEMTFSIPDLSTGMINRNYRIHINLPQGAPRPSKEERSIDLNDMITRYVNILKIQSINKNSVTYRGDVVPTSLTNQPIPWNVLSDKARKQIQQHGVIKKFIFGEVM